MSDKNYLNYWDLNIKKWGDLYFNKNLHKVDGNANFITKKCISSHQANYDNLNGNSFIDNKFNTFIYESRKY